MDGGGVVSTSTDVVNEGAVEVEDVWLVVDGVVCVE